MIETNLTRSRQGIVIKKNLGQFGVQADGQLVACILSTRLVKPLQSARKPKTAAVELAVGDEVRFIPAQTGLGQIIEVLPRRSQLSRRGAVAWGGAHASEQVLVANVDQVVPVFAAANPTPHWNMLDRYLVTAEAYDLPALICITKQDLVGTTSPAEQATLNAVLDEYRRIGYAVVRVSSFNGEGVAELRAALRGRISVLVGKSGVGKTSLLNALQPGLGLRVNAVNQITGKGRHTTTAQEMFPLEDGGAIVDTTGEREFGLWDVAADELAELFPEMRTSAVACRFGRGCRHLEEPGCAVRRAVMDGRISPRRYQSYVRLREDG